MPAVSKKTPAPKKRTVTRRKKVVPADDLSVIYRNRDGSLPNLTRLERAPRRRMLRSLLGIALLFLMGSGAVAGWMFFQKQNSSREVPLVVEVSPFTEVVSGGELGLRVRYRNSSSKPLGRVDIRLRNLDGFSFLTSTPEPTDPLTWSVGPLEASASGFVDIRGTLLTEIPTDLSFQFTALYRPASFRADFEETFTFPLSVNTSVLATELVGPETAIPGDELTYTLRVQNTAESDLAAVEIAATLPEGFTLITSEPAAAEDRSAWTLETLAAGQTQTITFTGTFAPTEAKAALFHVDASLPLEQSSSRVIQARAETTTQVSGTSLVYHLVANGSGTRGVVAHDGRLRFSIDYANRGTEAIREAAIRLVFALPEGGAGGDLPLNLQDADLANGIRRSDGSIFWDSSRVPALARLEPGASGVIDVVIPLEEGAYPPLASEFSAYVRASMQAIGSQNAPRILQTPMLPVTVVPSLSLQTEARYFDADGVVLGSGPLPPVVGQTTGYRVFWTLQNTWRPIDGIRLSAHLPANVTWRSGTSPIVGNLAFDEGRREIVWSIPRLEVLSEPLAASFTIALRPEANQIGQSPVLLEALVCTATDSATGLALLCGGETLTTVLPTDEGAAGKGVVQATATP